MIKFFALFITSIYFFCSSVFAKEITIDIFFISDAKEWYALMEFYGR